VCLGLGLGLASLETETGRTQLQAKLAKISFLCRESDQKCNQVKQLHLREADTAEAETASGAHGLPRGATVSNLFRILLISRLFFTLLLYFLFFRRYSYETQYFYLHSYEVYSLRGLERGEMGSHEIRPIHSAPSLGQSIDYV